MLLCEFSINVIVYITGFIVHKIQKKIRWIECLKVLLTTPSEITYHALIKIKSRGYLIHPSADVVFIYRSAEKAIKSRFDNGNITKHLQREIENEIIHKFIDRNIFSELNTHRKPRTIAKSPILFNQINCRNICKNAYMSSVKIIYSKTERKTIL